MTKTSRASLAHIVADRTLASGINKRYVREIASLLLDEGRTGELDSLLRDVQADWARSGHVEVITASAHPLAGDTRRDITKQIARLYPAAKKIVITETRDPDIIGGVRVSLPNKQLDLSIETKLNRLKQLTTAGKDQ